MVPARRWTCRFKRWRTVETLGKGEKSMCILCVASRWSRRVVTMLPWLVIPFIIVWAFSQLLPPGYRLEVTSTRLACLGVLLSSLGWYELLMPWLSTWRARRSAILRERKLIEAQEAAKWKKEATRRCRNCLTPYKIQSPGGGRFTCTYCGHVSKRPVLDVPSSASQAGGQGLHKIWHSGGQIGKGAILRSRSTRNSDSGCWSKPPERRSCWLGDGTCGDENCRASQYFMRVLHCVGSLLLYLGIIWRRVTGAGRLASESCRGVQKGKDEFSLSQESRNEKARKKANERKQARLERELEEAEEKKQREEFARLVDERRTQREEKLQIKKDSEREAAAEREREIRRVKETERRRKDKAKERAEEELDAKDECRTHCNETHVRCGEQQDSDTSVEIPKSSTMSKLSASNRYNQGSKSYLPSDIQTRLDSLRHRWNVKRRPTVAFNSRSGTQVDTKTSIQLLGNKACKVEPLIPSNKKPIISKHDGDESTSTSVHGKAPCLNAWAKGTEALKLHLTSSDSGFPGNVCQKVESNGKDGCSLFNNKAVGSRQGSASGISPGAQRPIAPPSINTPSLHQLFSSPTIFQTLDLTANITGESKQPMPGNIKPSFRPEHTFFEAPSPISFQSCTGASASTCPAGPVHGSLCSLPQITVNVDDEAVHYMDASHQSILSEPLKQEQNGKSTDNLCRPVSPGFESISDAAISESKMDLSPASLSLMSNTSNFTLENRDLLSWDLDPACLDKTNDGDEMAQEQIWTMLISSNTDVDEQFGLVKDKDSDTMQLSDLSTVHSLFDAEFLLPDSLSLSPHKKASVLQSSESTTNTGQLFESNSLWSDISAFDSTVQMWDDSDNNQKLPPEFVDCITQEVMKDPVITADGHSYERAAIEKWLKLHDTSPKTGEVLPPPPGGFGVDKTLRPNHILRGQIIDYNEKLAKMQQNSVSWTNTSKDGEHFLPCTFGVPSFY